MTKKRQTYSLGGKPISEIMPEPIIAQRAPTANDTGYPLGSLWIYPGTGTYILNQVAAGSATWTTFTPGSSDVDTLTGDAGGAITPTLGDIVLAGGTNITSTGAGSTITFAVDDAITLATSVTSPIYTSAADMAITAPTGGDIAIGLGDNAGANELSFTNFAGAEIAYLASTGDFEAGTVTAQTSMTTPILNGEAAFDLDINTPAGQDLIITLGDAAGANFISIQDSASVEMAQINSDGYINCVGIDGILGSATPAAADVTTLEATTSVLSPLYITAAATDMEIQATAGQDIIFTMGDNGGANFIYFNDSDDANVASLDSDGGLTVVAFTFAGLLTASASATIETAGTALNLATDNDAAAVNIGLGNVARAISIGTSAAAHTVAIGSASAGAITIDTAAGFSLDAATASNITVTGAGVDLSLQGVGGAVNVTSTQTENDAILIEASAGNGGVQIHAGTGGILIGDEADTTGITLGNIAPTATRNITIGSGTVVTASVTDTISIGAGGATTNADSVKTVIINTGDVEVGEVNTNIATGACTSGTHATAIATGNRAAGTMTLNMFTGTGTKVANIGNADGLTTFNVDAITLINDSINVATSINTGTSTGAVSIGNAAAGTVTIDSAALLELNVAAAGAINIGNDAVASDIAIGDTTGASSLTLSAGTGEITVNGTVKEIDAEFLSRSGDDVTFHCNPICLLSGNAPALPTGATGTVNLLGFPEMTMEQYILGAGQTIISPVMDATGLLVSGDLTATEGFEYNFGAALATSRHTYTIGTSAAFFLEWRFTVADVTGAESIMIGFRKTEANNATLTSYTDYALIGLDNVTSPGNVVISTELNSGGTTNTNTTDAWGDGETHTLGVYVSAAGVVTYTVDGAAPSVTAAFTFDNGDTIAPIFRLMHGAAAPGAIHWQSMKCGFQA